ncbi:DUF6929 family protein [Roseimarinus sediminis]|uniref:DUF6929 family protein n=1 Tax=Roseimarinus sediminis TaxID=1610899 RepID=UPI003D231494
MVRIIDWAYLIVLFFLLLLTACDKQQAGFIVQERHILTGLPSASGVEVLASAIYVTGDDSPWLFRLDESFRVAEKTALGGERPDSIFDKAVKPDYEAMTVLEHNGVEELLIMGSGSKSPWRDKIVRINPKAASGPLTFDAGALYQKMREASVLDETTFNIEAVAANGQNIYLFNRGVNLIFEFGQEALMTYLEGSGVLPEFRWYHIHLPALNGIGAGFSGASFLPGGRKIVFTASVENTSDTYHDGEILGSFVGIVDVSELANELSPWLVFIEENAKPLKLKVESVLPVSVSANNSIQLLMVSDSDGGSSELIKGVLTEKEE